MINSVCTTSRPSYSSPSVPHQSHVVLFTTHVQRLIILLYSLQQPQPKNIGDQFQIHDKGSTGEVSEQKRGRQNLKLPIPKLEKWRDLTFLYRLNWTGLSLLSQPHLTSTQDGINKVMDWPTPHYATPHHHHRNF